MKKRRTNEKKFKKLFNEFIEKILEYYPDDQYYHSSEHIVAMLNCSKKNIRSCEKRIS